MDSRLLIALSILLGIAVLYLRIQLWLSRHDANLLRQTTVVVAPPEPSEQGCLTPLLAVLLLGAFGLLLMLAGQL